MRRYYWLRVIKLSILAVRMIWISSWWYKTPNTKSIQEYIGAVCPPLLPFVKFFPKGYFVLALFKFLPRPFSLIHSFKQQFFNRDFIDSKCITVNYKDARPVASSLDGFVALAWLCEEMKINIKIQQPARMIWQHFKNDNLINVTNGLEQEFKPCKRLFFANYIAYLGIFFVSSEYGHKVLSRLSIKEDLKKSANQWVDKHIRGDWVAVHYRGTDIAYAQKEGTKNRYRIKLDLYITYLKEVLDNQCSIFACSDQVQFIDKMHAAFPGRVFARDIQRSNDSYPIHRHDCVGIKPRKGIDHFNQEKDALIDILILAKAPLIYTTGSGFVDAVRYFNPQIKIVSLDSRKIGRGKNNMPIPREDLFKKLAIPL